ncbi:S8 family serine peptidase [Halorhabdus rudnickae]|uniref:S8 family serine peptidase n=1 Tax=Halorhabdus rudnickae TaxID=1775544 RepID=UPI0010835129|nr:S8 family serine peptidase [Halorhabdus rudnickae]
MSHRGIGTTVLVAIVIIVAALVVPPAVGAVGLADGPASVAADASASQDNETNGVEHVAKIVEFKDKSVRDTMVMPDGIEVTGGTDVDFIPVAFAEGPPAAFETLERRPGVVRVLDDGRVRIEPPNETESTVSTSDEATTASQLVPWGIDRISAPSAWGSVSNDAVGQVDVAVLDTGIDFRHDDLDVAWGANFANGVEEYGRYAGLDNQGHGTAVAGVVAAADDGNGVVGVSPGVDVYSVKVLNESGVGRLSWIIDGIDASLKGQDGTLGTDDDADVLSLSLGSFGGYSSYQNWINDASDHAVVVAAAGNSGDDDVSTDEVTYPARYDGAIAVAATDQLNETWDYSAEGDTVELAAPGVDITTTGRGGGLVSVSGTSLATPHVSGVAALVIAQDLEDGSQDLSPAEVRTRLQDAAVDIEADGIDRRSGHGLVVATEAVEGSPADGATFSIEGLSPGGTSVVQGEMVTVSGIVTNTGSETGTETVELRLDGQTIDSESVSLAPGGSTTVSFPGFHTTNLNPGTHSYSVTSPHDERTSTLTVLEPATFELSALEPGNITVTAGESVDISATVTNTGDVSDTKTAEVRVDGETVDSESVSLGAGTSESVSFTISTDGNEVGTVEYGVYTPDGEVVGSLTVGASETLSIEGPKQVHAPAGTTANLTYTVVNEGVTQPSSGSVQLTSIPDSLEVIGSNFSLLGVSEPVPGPGESADVTFRLDVPEVANGSYPVTVNASLGSVSISTVTEITTNEQWYVPYVTDKNVVDANGINAAIKDYLEGDLTDRRLNTVVTSYLNGTPIE